MFGERLKSLRNNSGKTQQQIADMLGITRAAYSHFENNRNQPDSETLVQLANIFDVSTDYLLGASEIKSEVTQEKTVTVESALDSIMTSDGKKLSEDDKRVAADIIKRLLEDGK